MPGRSSASVAHLLAILITTTSVHGGTLKYRLFLIFLMLLLIPQASQASDKKGVLNSTIELCLDMPSGPDAVMHEFAGLGWKSKSGQEAFRVNANVVYSNVFTSNHITNDLEQTYRIAEFSSVSILKSARSTVDQMAFSSGDMQLSVLGTLGGTGSCFLSGPKFLAEQAARKFSVLLDSKNTYLRTQRFSVGTHIVRIQEIDIQRFHLVETGVPAETLQSFRETDKRALREGNLYIGENRWRAKR